MVFALIWTNMLHFVIVITGTSDWGTKTRDGWYTGREESEGGNLRIYRLTGRDYTNGPASNLTVASL